MQPTCDAALRARASAAIELVKQRELSPESALWMVVFPSVDVEAACERLAAAGGQRGSGPRVADQLVDHAAALVAGGMSISAAARAIGVNKAVVEHRVRHRGRPGVA